MTDSGTSSGCRWRPPGATTPGGSGVVACHGLALAGLPSGRA